MIGTEFQIIPLSSSAQGLTLGRELRQEQVFCHAAEHWHRNATRAPLVRYAAAQGWLADI